MPEIINFKDLPAYKIGDALFPNIAYDSVDLVRTKTTIKAAFTNIKKNGQFHFIENLETIWNADGDIHWQNHMLKHLQGKIFEMIDEWNINQQNQFLLTKIFVWIQLWGGNTSRGFFLLKNGGFDKNFDIKAYLSAIHNIEISPIKSLQLLNGMNRMKTAFATKHLMFWSKGDLPIYDSIIAKGVYGRKSVNNRISVYQNYLNDINMISEKMNTSVSQIERSLFNYFDTPEGQNWIAIRMNQL